MSLSEVPPPIMLSSVTNYVELAALVLPPRQLGVKDKLRRACPFLPMPLSLGWDTHPDDEEAPPGSTVRGLYLSDIKSGATRLVTASWMHALYKHTQDVQKPGTLVMHLREAGFTTQFSWVHTLVLGTFLLQSSVVLLALMIGQQREGWLLLAAGLIRISEALFAWAYPKYEDPRSTYREQPRYCALHTGMTTNHILVVTHRFGYRGKCVNLEDAAAPRLCKVTGWKRIVKHGARSVLRAAVWIQKGASLVTAANGYTIPAVLLLGTFVLEIVSASEDALPSRAVTVLPTGESVLDRLTAACQVTESISVGFVESLLPDPCGKHVDYDWISKALRLGAELQPHESHPAKEDILESTIRRRRFQVVKLLSVTAFSDKMYSIQLLPPVLPPVFPPRAATAEP
ncbi:hypothetical protein MVEN_01970400 [Mycena venus]|uniref:Uncharacterized protein n=1 Tax=Mycena venus TaxID=2733690 RepID=A0A8H6XD69_9AGAR|nr:hypothetical protein MVEN_01970400 [Mycena venus]